MTEAGGFISSWHREHVNVSELPGAFESMLIHIGCEPATTVPLVFSRASRIFSATPLKQQFPFAAIFLVRGFFFSCSLKGTLRETVGMKKTFCIAETSRCCIFLCVSPDRKIPKTLLA